MKIPTMLHVEDDENDRVLLKFAHERAHVPINIVAVEDGEEAISYLRGEGAYSDFESCPPPALVLLDLKMPLRDGFEVLEWIRKQEKFRELPVIIMSSSGQDCDLQHAFRSGATSYIIKPISFESLIGTVRQIYASWLAGETATANSFCDDEMLDHHLVTCA
jgi:CheY-like chemotaxis protein